MSLAERRWRCLCGSATVPRGTASLTCPSAFRLSADGDIFTEISRGTDKWLRFVAAYLGLIELVCARSARFGADRRRAGLVVLGACGLASRGSL